MRASRCGSRAYPPRKGRPAAPPPRRRALAVLRNFGANLLRRNSIAVVGTLLAEERRYPELLAAFRSRLVEPRRSALRRILTEGISSGELPHSADPDILASMLIGSFYARYRHLRHTL